VQAESICILTSPQILCPGVLWINQNLAVSRRVGGNNGEWVYVRVHNEGLGMGLGFGRFNIIRCVLIDRGDCDNCINGSLESIVDYNFDLRGGHFASLDRGLEVGVGVGELYVTQD